MLSISSSTHPAIVLFLFTIATAILYVDSQLVSPCPRLFKYELPQTENDRWYGVITLLSETELSGVWLRIILDRQSMQLGNWFGEVKTDDNKEYLIKNRNHKLQANQPYQLRFYIKYNPAEPPPQLASFRLNARTACPENGLVTEAPITSGQGFTSSELSTTARPEPIPQPPSQIDNFAPVFGFGSDEDDGVFAGDQHLIQNRPVNRPRPNPNNVQCGTIVKQPKPLITYGQGTHEGEFPWHVALYHSRGSDLTYICGGSLVSPYHILTAAHCVTTTRTQKVIDAESLVVYLGKYYLKRWGSPNIQDRHVERITVHPKYSRMTFSNDLAIIRLIEPAEITNFVRPVCLWDEDTRLQTIVNRAGTVVGWGFDQNGRITDSLTKGFMPVVSQETCIYSLPDFYSRFTSSTTFCAGFRNGTSVCNGDSGGGMVFPKSNSPTRNQIWQLRGIISISVALQNELKCDTSNYVVFTDVAQYLDWIRANLN